MSNFVFFLSSFCCTTQIYGEKEVIDVLAISNLQVTYGAIIVAAQKLAFEHINNNEADLLANYTLNLTLLDAKEDTTIALQHVLDIMIGYHHIHNRTSNNLSLHQTLPIVLGCPWSSLSSITAPALGTMNWAQISSSSTSISLSDSIRYPTFYRTIAADSLQSAGLIGLLEYFGWTRFSIIYVNDVYGIYLTMEVMRLASIHKTLSFQLTPIAYTSGDAASIKFAVQQLKQTDKSFINIAIVHGVDIKTFFAELEANGLWGYPYFYIGVDVWCDEATINATNISTFVDGYLGTAPWGSHMLSHSDYLDTNAGKLSETHNQSFQTYQFVHDMWIAKYTVDPAFFFGIHVPSALSNYGWDSAYTVAHILQHIIDENEGSLTGTNLLKFNSDYYNEIIVNHISFIGATGNVSYKDNGDRDQALFAFGNILENGKIEWVGYFSDYYNVTHLRFDSIVWPKDFTERGMTPRSHVLITNSMTTINVSLFMTIMGVTALSTLVVIVYIAYTILHRQHRVLKAASWKLKIVSCIGCIIAYIYVITVGMNEANFLSVYVSSICCNIQLWLISIAFTLLFMPLFLKTYRVSIIFSAGIKDVDLTDLRLLVVVAGCTCIDIILSTIFTAVAPQKRLQSKSVLETVDALRQTQYIFGECASSGIVVNYLFYGFVGLYKTIQILFGIYCCLVVSRIGIKEIRKFDETSTELLAITVTVLLCVLTVFATVFIPNHELDLLYGIQSSVIIVICNICLAFSLLPRFYAIWTGNEDKYKITPQDRLRELLQKQFAAPVSAEFKMKTAPPRTSYTPRYKRCQNKNINVNVQKSTLKDSNLEAINVSDVNLGIGLPQTIMTANTSTTEIIIEESEKDESDYDSINEMMDILNEIVDDHDNEIEMEMETISDNNKNLER